MAKKRISDDPAGFNVLTEMLAAAGDSSDDVTFPRDRGGISYKE